MWSFESMRSLLYPARAPMAPSLKRKQVNICLNEGLVYDSPLFFSILCPT